MFNYFVAQNSYGSSPASTITITRMSIGGDVNGDGIIDDYDLSLVVSHWMQDYEEGDFNDDGVVNDFDLSIIAAFWGQRI